MQESVINSNNTEIATAVKSNLKLVDNTLDLWVERIQELQVELRSKSTDYDSASNDVRTLIEGYASSVEAVHNMEVTFAKSVTNMHKSVDQLRAKISAGTSKTETERELDRLWESLKI